MSAWFDALSSLQQTLFAIALFSTLVFAIQVVLTLFGLGESGDPDLGGVADDIDGGRGIPFSDLFTIRNGVSFLMGFAWGGLMAYDWGLAHTFPVLVVGFVLGCVFAAMAVADRVFDYCSTVAVVCRDEGDCTVAIVDNLTFARDQRGRNHLKVVAIGIAEERRHVHPNGEPGRQLEPFL